jgi:hypothetical protein
VSIEAFLKGIEERLKRDQQTCELDSAAIILWLTKVFLFFDFISLETKAKQEQLLEFVEGRSLKSVGFFWNRSLSNIIVEAEAPAGQQVYAGVATIKRHARNLAALSRIAWFRITVFSLCWTRRIVVFDGVALDKTKVLDFVTAKSDEASALAPLYPIAFPRVSDEESGKASARSNSGSRNILRIVAICDAVLAESIVKIPSSEHDCLVRLRGIELALANLPRLMPSELVNELNWAKKVWRFIVRRYQKSPISVFDYCGAIIKNRALFGITAVCNCDTYGVQHGGEYGEIRSPVTAFELTNPAYNKGFLGWGFTPKYADLKRAQAKDNLIKVPGRRVILYPESIDSNLRYNRSADLAVNERRNLGKTYIAAALAEQNEPYWIKPHPKSSGLTRTNIDQLDLIDGLHKPGLDSNSIQIVLFDAPCQTLFFDCLKQNISCLLCFPLSAYELSASALAYFEQLEHIGMLLDLDKRINRGSNAIKDSIATLLKNPLLLPPLPNQ